MTHVRLLRSNEFAQIENEINDLLKQGYKVRTTGFSDDAATFSAFLIRVDDDSSDLHIDEPAVAKEARHYVSKYMRGGRR